LISRYLFLDLLIVEAEYQFWFFHGGNCPGLVENIKENKLKYIKGWNYQKEDIENIAEYLRLKIIHQK
jgi:hypothetical protein